jgi:phosphohistidine phosphatase
MLLRHGLAEAHGPLGDDASRRLTPQGELEVQRVAALLAARAPRPSALLSSPKARAWRTAELAGAAWGLSPKPWPILAQEPHLPLAAALRSLAEPAPMLVGHEPTLSALAEHLLNPAHPVRGIIELAKAGCICLSLDPQRPDQAGALHWHLTPQLC